ncbi:MAG TPA: DUF4198 domain-containing protein [Hyphomicrobiaceae bacterium]|nr:DUF4198 domain-containing protein [Hyphomicrobiaceae bacterium]
MIEPLRQDMGKAEDGIFELMREGAAGLGASDQHGLAEFALLDPANGDEPTIRTVGLPLAIVAESNPHGLKAGESLPVRVLFRGKPIAGLPFKVFNLKGPKSPR